MKVALASALLIASTNAGYIKYKGPDASCHCESVCAIWADPHIVTFDGQGTTFSNGDDSFTAYKKNGLQVEGVTTSKDSTLQSVKVSYNGEAQSFNAADCGKDRKKVFDKTFTDENGLDATVTAICHEAPEGLDNRSPHYFNLFVTTRCAGEGMNAAQIEKENKASGECVALTLPHKNVTQNAKIPSFPEHPLPANKCICDATCTARGDPHVHSFDGAQFKVQAEKFDEVVMYENEEKKIRVAGVLDSMKHFHNLTFVANGKSQTFTTDQCNGKKNGENIDTVVVKAENEDEIVFMPQCNTRPNKLRHDGVYLDLMVNSTVTVYDAFNSWAEMDTARGFVGECLREKKN
mmetsp:Transcript_12894/g.27609  ORF Transcript_12894/g.27609 Transcript_12894/m.27609 type:complete len:349 (-) Transcript_12894:36-1082(-)